MKKTMLLVLAVGAAISLSACGGGSGGKTVVVAPPAPAVTAKFGAKFEADFKADPNAIPAAVASGDIVPVDPTAKPSALQ